MFTQREYELIEEGLEATISVLVSGEDRPDKKWMERFGARIKELQTLKNKILRLAEKQRFDKEMGW